MRLNFYKWETPCAHGRQRSSLHGGHAARCLVMIASAALRGTQSEGSGTKYRFTAATNYSCYICPPVEHASLHDHGSGHGCRSRRISLVGALGTEGVLQAIKWSTCPPPLFPTSVQDHREMGNERMPGKSREGAEILKMPKESNLTEIT